ncbi:MAG: hypothetical protein LBT53_09110 [Puniceicoccales bacterium]|jgi:hypothetical protein|nr:hypothetical protein [Puniceicoccales bacterium]
MRQTPPQTSPRRPPQKKRHSIGFADFADFCGFAQIRAATAPDRFAPIFPAVSTNRAILS